MSSSGLSSQLTRPVTMSHHSGTVSETASSTSNPVATPKADASAPALEALVHELRQFREDFAPRADELNPYDLPSTASPSPRDRALLVQVQQQALQLAAAEYQLLSAKRDAKDLRSALDEANADKARLQRQLALNTSAKSEIATMDVVQKEFTKLKRYLDFRLEHFIGQFSTSTPSRAFSSAPVSSPTAFVATKGSSLKTQATATRQPLLHAWRFETTTSQTPHRLDHPDDCNCSVACLQWGEVSAAETAIMGKEALHGNPSSYSNYMSPISAAILKGNHDGQNCHCIICMQWSTPPSPAHCGSSSGYACSGFGCRSTRAQTTDKADREGRPSHSAKSSIHSSHSTSNAPFNSRLGQPSGKAFGNDSHSIMLNYMLNSNAGSPAGSVNRVSTRSRANSSAAVSSWTPPKAPSVCPPPSSARWPTSLMYA
ncbi:hypothetical protein A1Q2_04281 [Trichosporon asahii var. asahii CBS 8904]|uniref:Uncharacterized protein n=1 Tax=Trichosporon asahii var. asahii (strain CBS 8904) TaxID=1220162 RepID=K1WJ25_TRIAC|nr:hypothetical protein A1Q2_04281 [Trichosporon asahii var. asahii CBS 8904]